MTALRPLSHDTTRYVAERCLCFAAQRAARMLARRFDQALAVLGITNGQFSLMMSLNRPEPPVMRDVAKLLGMDRTTLTAALKLLERHGLVDICVDDEDRRGRRLSLTGAGRKLLRRALPIWEQTIGEVEQELADPSRLRRDLWAISGRDD